MAVASWPKPEIKTKEREFLATETAEPTSYSTGEYVPKMRNRIPEQIERDRAALMSGVHKPHPLPLGETVWDRIVGQWPGDETDEEIAIALEELS